MDGGQLEIERQTDTQDSNDTGKVAHHAAEYAPLRTCPSSGRSKGRDLGGISTCTRIGIWNPADPGVGFTTTGGDYEGG